MLLFDFHAIKWWLNYSGALDFMFQGQLWREGRHSYITTKQGRTKPPQCFFNGRRAVRKYFVPALDAAKKTDGEMEHLEIIV